jgi:hypothetical protein
MIKKLRNQPYAPKNGSEEKEEKKTRYDVPHYKIFSNP